MKKLAKQQPYFIHFGWDEGGPESGPVMKGDIDVVWGISKEDVLEKWKNEVDTSNFDTYWAEPTTEEEAQKYIKDNGLEDVYYPSVEEKSKIEMMKEYVKEHHLERFVKELNSQGNNFEGALEWVYDQNTMTPEEFKEKYYK